MHLASGIATLCCSKWLLFIDPWCIRVPTGSENVVLLPTQTRAHVHIHTYTDCVLCRIQPPWREAFALGHIYSNSKLNPSIHLTVFIFFPPLGDWDQQEKKGVWSPWGGGEEKEPVMSNSGESLYKLTSYERVSHAGCHIKESSDIFTVSLPPYAAFVVVIHKGP